MSMTKRMLYSCCRSSSEYGHVSPRLLLRRGRGARRIERDGRFCLHADAGLEGLNGTRESAYGWKQRAVHAPKQESAVNAPEYLPLPDTQSLPDVRELPIQRVGVKGLRYPVALRATEGAVQNTIAEFGMYVGLAHDVKGTHMSRFVEILEERRAPLDLAGFRAMHQRMLARLGAVTGRLDMRFPYFIRKTAPVSGVQSLLAYDASCAAETDADARTRLTAGRMSPLTTLCPCATNTADYAGNQQRRHITI